MDAIKQPWRNLLAVIVGIGPIFGFVIGSHIATGGAYTLKAMLLNPLIFGTGTIVWLGFLYRFFCRKDWKRINRKTGSLGADALAGIGLATGLTLVWFLEHATLDRWLPRSPGGGTTVLNLLGGLSRDPLLMAVWLGPVVWIGVAAFEEIQRAFTLDLLSDVFVKRWQKGLVLVLSSVIFGLAHLYQGPAGIVGTFVFAMAMGLYYLAAGRIGPLIIGHALYDSAQIIMGIIEIRRAGF